MKIIILSLLLLTSACTIYSSRRDRFPSSNYENYELSMMGASNTAGMGASISFSDRINEYLKVVPPQQRAALTNQKIFIAFDYFFPTNFSALNDSSKDHLSVAKETISEWQAQYDHVFVMKLPTNKDHMSEFAKRYIENSGKRNPYKNILNVLSDQQILSRVQSLNNLIDTMALENANVHNVSFSGIFEYLHDYAYSRRNRAARRKRPRVIDPEALFADPLHLNDLGQAKFFNAIILPELNQTFNSNLPPMDVVSLSEREVRRIIRSKLCASDSFLNKDDCNYWIVLKDPSQYKLSSARLHLPASYTQERKALNISADNKRKIWKLAEETKSAFQRKSLLDVMAIAEIVDGNGETAEKGLMINVLNDREKVYLDLSKVLFFTTFPIFKEQGSETYSNWGYDHWLSYKYFYTRFSYSGMYTDQTMVGRLKSPAPGTNYKIDVQFDKEKKEMTMKWRIYPTVKNQDDEQSRLEYIPEPHLSEIQNNQEEYPYVEYVLDFKLDDMK